MTITDTMKTPLLNALTPKYTILLPTESEQGRILPPCPKRTLLWLHGFRERAKDLLAKSPLETLAQKHNIAIIIPDVPDTYYLDQPWNNCLTQTFLMEEFLPHIIDKYHLPSGPENTSIGGNSMGGFGSLLLGSRYPEIFGHIISISGAFIINDILEETPEVVGKLPDNLIYFKNLFGDLPSLGTSVRRNPEIAAKHALAAGTNLSLFLSCGTGDMLCSRNLRLKEQLLAAGASVTWLEHPGRHDWKSSRTALKMAFQYFDE